MTLEELIYLKFISPGTLLTLKILSIGISLFFLIAIFYFIKNTTWLKFRYAEDLKEFFAFKPYEIKRFEKVWAKITKRLERPLESEYKLAIIEADNLLNKILERMGYKEETLGERLKKITADILPNIQEVSEAHKIRNNIVHDPDYKITLEKAQKTIKIYEKAFQGLNVF